MLSYAETLADFTAALSDAEHVPAGLTEATRERIAVYRNNVRLNRMDALPAAFPLVAELVGEEYFRALARVYVIDTPARSANLHDDGASLADFIAGFGPAQELPYLADVARLDWARHRAYYADNVPPLDATEVAALSPEQFSAARFWFHPAVALVQSAQWPIADLLAMHEGGPTAHIDAGGQTVLVWRGSNGVAWRQLNDDEARWLSTLLAGSSVGEALAAAQEDPNPLLTHLFAHGLVSHVDQYVDPQRDHQNDQQKEPEETTP
ncbi:HvfC/BufC family peptide modification chaperone [Andreprevotia chitinilytica]|uniref:HvfC/BufC family peptide modification chaperone n=1 Tax=Andreprevotia chitinilytica TaxID=396808 RepID=UPI00068ABC6F|nr:putative DNA-binding domain-containing protein [Andreprevotia chitinilytica]